MQRVDTSRPGREFYRELTPRDHQPLREPTPQKCRICGIGPENLRGWVGKTLCRPCCDAGLRAIEAIT